MILAAIICDFGEFEDGVNLYRINGSKEEIAKAIKDLKELGFELWNDPYELEKSHKSWSVLLKLQVPPEIKKRDKELKELHDREFKERNIN